MSTFKGQERRRIQRTKLVTFCPASFSYKDREYEAMMGDVSEFGAGFFHSEPPNAGLQFKNGDVIALTIKTPYGESQAKASVVWSRHLGENYSWGMQFVEISKDKKDPLRCLMDSPF
jgi:hypothetical protein